MGRADSEPGRLSQGPVARAWPTARASGGSSDTIAGEAGHRTEDRRTAQHGHGSSRAPELIDRHASMSEHVVGPVHSAPARHGARGTVRSSRLRPHTF